MNIREEARKVGGEEMVARVDTMQRWEMELVKELEKVTERFLKERGLVDGEEDPMLMKMATTAMAEAMSEVYAIAAVVCFKTSHEGPNRTQALTMAIRSLSGNMDKYFDTLDAKESGVEDKILAAWKGGK